MMSWNIDTPNVSVLEETQKGLKSFYDIGWISVPEIHYRPINFKNVASHPSPFFKNHATNQFKNMSEVSKGFWFPGQ